MSELKRVRSPNYPAISLVDAMEAAQKLESRIGQNPAAREAIVKVLGFGGLNGASAGALSALVKYGLMEKSGHDLKLSDRAIRLLFSKTTDEHIDALWEAARAPSLFAELVEQYKGKLPDDEVIRSYLKRKGFADSALPHVIQSFRETMEFVTREAGAYDPIRATQDGIMQTIQEVQREQASKIAPVLNTALLKPATGERELTTGMLSKNASFRLIVNGEVGVKEIDRLIAKLQLDKEILADPDSDQGED